MAEGRVYRCKWIVRDGVCRVWIEKPRRLTADGHSLDEALSELSSVVCKATGDGEAVFDLDPPRGGDGSNGFVSLIYNESWSPPAGFSRGDFAALYEGGMCVDCCRGIGERTEMPLPVGRLGNGDLLGACLRMPSVMLASQRFRDLLSATQQASLNWREIETHRRTQRTFYEVTAKRPVEAVADRDQAVNGWKCSTCGYRMFGVHGNYEQIYVSLADFPTKRATVFGIQTSHHVEIAVKQNWWRAHCGKPGSRSILARAVVGLPPARVWREPDVPTLVPSQIRSIRREFARLAQSD